MACGIMAMRRAFSLETAKKPFCHRIVQTITFSTHATADAMCNQQVLIIMTGLLTASIRMVDESSVRLSDQEGHA